MNHCDLSCLVVHCFLPYVFLHIAYIIHLSHANGASYLWQMVRTCTSDFVLDVPEGSSAHRRLRPPDLVGLLLRLHHCHHHLHYP
jgi:hypothetical protein